MFVKVEGAKNANHDILFVRRPPTHTHTQCHSVFGIGTDIRSDCWNMFGCEAHLETRTLPLAAKESS